MIVGCVDDGGLLVVMGLRTMPAVELAIKKTLEGNGNRLGKYTRVRSSRIVKAGMYYRNAPLRWRTLVFIHPSEAHLALALRTTWWFTVL